MHIQDRLRIAGAGIAAQLLKYYDEGPPGLFGHPPVSESGWLWWQTPIALQALLSHEEISFDTSHHSHIQEAFLLNLGNDHRIFSPAWGGIENDEKNDDMLWWTLAALQANDSVILEGALRSYDHVRRFWANEAGSSCLGGVRWSADPSHSGWSYLNSVTNGQFFLASATFAFRKTAKVQKLNMNGPRPRSPPARPTDECIPGMSCDFELEQPFYYERWGTKVYEWMKKMNLISSIDYAVYDGITAPLCDTRLLARSDQWSHNIALPLLGTAIMYQKTHSARWLKEHQALRRHVLDHFVDAANVLYEPACKLSVCEGNDWTIFLAVLARSLAQAYAILPNEDIRQVILATANHTLTTCHHDWTCPNTASPADVSTVAGSGLMYGQLQDGTQKVLRISGQRVQGYIQAQVVALEVVSAARMVL